VPVAELGRWERSDRSVFSSEAARGGYLCRAQRSGADSKPRYEQPTVSVRSLPPDAVADSPSTQTVGVLLPSTVSVLPWRSFAKARLLPPVTLAVLSSLLLGQCFVDSY
jgi:hypothetical protein